jgi:hypothetical protein
VPVPHRVALQALISCSSVLCNLCLSLHPLCIQQTCPMCSSDNFFGYRSRMDLKGWLPPFYV